MTMLNVERMKLTSTRSPWWCAATTIVLSVGLAIIIAFGSRSTGPDGQTFEMTVTDTQGGAVQLGLFVVMVMAALAVTTEYRFGIIRTTFQAVPNRTSVVANKALVLAVVAALLGELVAFASLFLARIISDSPLALAGAADWRATAGVGLVFALAAMFAVAIGVIVRQSAGAIAFLLLFPIAVENLVQLIPRVGDDIHRWMPFTSAQRFLGQGFNPDALGPWPSLGYFALIVAVVLGVAVLVVNTRDA